jgi:DNA-binding transcriptional MerR regulator
MDGYLSIGQMSNLTGVSIPTLRYYESIGLLKPSYVNPQTNYRYYSVIHCWLIEIIVLLRRLGFPMKLIKAIQGEQDLRKLVSDIHAQKEKTLETIEHLKTLVSDMEWLEEGWRVIADMETGATPRITVVQKPARKVIFVEAEEGQRDYSFDNSDILQMRTQVFANKEINKTNSIRCNYGYQLDKDAFLNGKFRFIGEFVEFERYQAVKEADLVTIPGGDYLCFSARMFAGLEWLDQLREYLWNNELQAKAIYASEVSLYFFDFKNTYHQIEVLLAK